MTKKVVVRLLCGGCDEKDHAEEFKYGRFFCSAKQTWVHPKDEGCEVALPIQCPKCNAIVFGDD